ncbi:MAG: diguanylate cyclase domain-containing protein [Actinomycetota bacterium]
MEASRKPVVLLIDDDPDTRALAEFQLSESFDVLQAPSGSEGLALASGQRPDVIVLDVMMPDLDGVSVMRKLAIDPATREIPVIFLSAVAEGDERAMALEVGAADFIMKPAHAREFVARVDMAARKGARKQDAAFSGQEGDLFHDRLQQEIARARRVNSSLALLLINVDGMTKINETHGRDGGDDFLRSVRRAIVATLRTSDTVFRLSGDEFGAILPDAEAGTAMVAAERCRAGIAALHGGAGGAEVSVGIAELMPGHGRDEFIAKARDALQKAKASGGHRSWRADDLRRRPLNPGSLAEDLTDREWGVVTHLAARRTEQEIAKRMGIRPGTVRSHKARIRRKLHVPPDIRLSDFVRSNFQDLMDGLDEAERKSGSSSA